MVYKPNRRSLFGVWIRGEGNPHKDHAFQDLEYPFFLLEDFEDPIRKMYFNASMEFLWNKTLHPDLPFRIEDIVSEDRTLNGVEIVSRLNCKYRIIRDKLFGFLEVISEEAYRFLIDRGYNSIVSIARSRKPILRCIMWGPLKYCQHEHGSPLRLMTIKVGQKCRLLDYGTNKDPVPDQQFGIQVVRLKVTSLSKEHGSDPLKLEWLMNERVIYDYGGNEYFVPDFVCLCRTCLA